MTTLATPAGTSSRRVGFDAATTAAPPRRPSIAPPRLSVEPADIRFDSLGGGRVLVDIRVRNVGAEASLPTVARVESAVLGAFLPWTPLRELRVPAITPGGTASVSFEAKEPAAARPLPSMARVTPGQVLTALDAFDQGRPLTPRLAPSLFEVIGRASDHWAGNINIFIGSSATERHRACSLRVAPGQRNVAMFVVGNRPDVYAFEVRGSGMHWQPRLMAVSQTVSIERAFAESRPLGERTWVRLGARSVMLLSFDPPADASSGELIVSVHQGSSRRATEVEFSFDAAAAGAGCYVT